MSLLTVEPQGLRIRLLDRETILEALQRRGYVYRTGCRQGNCGICKVRVLAGEVEYPRGISESALSEADRGSGLAITCRGVPAGDIVISMQDGSLQLISPHLAELPEREPDHS